MSDPIAVALLLVVVLLLALVALQARSDYTEDPERPWGKGW